MEGVAAAQECFSSKHAVMVYGAVAVLVENQGSLQGNLQGIQVEDTPHTALDSLGCRNVSIHLLHRASIVDSGAIESTDLADL